MEAREVINRLHQEGAFLRSPRCFSLRVIVQPKVARSLGSDPQDTGRSTGRERAYMCEATSEGGKVAWGNAAGAIDEALAITHWGELDR